MMEGAVHAQVRKAVKAEIKRGNKSGNALDNANYRIPSHDGTDELERRNTL